jgi:hypothetical protein
MFVIHRRTLLLVAFWPNPIRFLVIAPWYDSSKAAHLGAAVDPTAAAIEENNNG